MDVNTRKKPSTKGRKESLLLFALSLALGMFNVYQYLWMNIAAFVVSLLSAAVLFTFKFKENNYSNVLAYIKGELDIILLGIAIAISGGKYLLPVEHRLLPSILFITLLIFVFTFGERIRKPRRDS